MLMRFCGKLFQSMTVLGFLDFKKQIIYFIFVYLKEKLCFNHQILRKKTHAIMFKF